MSRPKPCWRLCRAKQPHTHRARLQVEQLESRIVPSVAELVKDVNLVPMGSGPGNLVEINGTVFFTASNPSNGRELWKSDGTANGTWQFSTDGGGTWTNMPSVSAKSALLLRGSDLVRCVPNDGFRGTAQLSYRCWDQTTGDAGDTANVTAGTATAFSLAAETTLVVVNTAPLLVV